MLPTHPQAPAACESGTPSCRRRPLGHEGLATLALRKLNRQPSGVPLSLTILPRGARRHCVSGPQSLRQDTERSTEEQHSSKPVRYEA
jgi:hypothetical protein